MSWNAINLLGVFHGAGDEVDRVFFVRFEVFESLSERRIEH